VTNTTTPVNMTNPSVTLNLTFQASSYPNVVASPSFTYHDNGVMLEIHNVYILYYGDSWDQASKSLIEYYVTNLGGTRWFNILSEYTDGNSTHHIINELTFMNSYSPTDLGKPSNTYLGTQVQDSDISQMVSDFIGATNVTVDPNGIYAIMLSQDVQETSGFCSNYCGYHDSYQYGNTDVKYVFVANANSCPNNCATQNPGSPNGNWQVDSMLSMLSHELTESITDPTAGGWFDGGTGNECADLCIWKYGTCQSGTDSNGNSYQYNVMAGSKKFYIQQNWSLSQGCVISR